MQVLRGTKMLFVTGIVVSVSRVNAVSNMGQVRGVLDAEGAFHEDQRSRGSMVRTEQGDSEMAASSLVETASETETISHARLSVVLERYPQPPSSLPFLKDEDHGCKGCCNDGTKETACMDVEACAAKAGATKGKYAFVLAQFGIPGGDFLPNIGPMSKHAKRDGMDIVLMMLKEHSDKLSDEQLAKMKEHGVKLRNVDWAVPPNMKYTKPKDWCGFQDFVRLHAFAQHEYDAVAYYDSDVQLQGNVLDVLRCASTGVLLSTNGGIGEPLNVGFFAARPDPRIMTAVNTFAQAANWSQEHGWANAGWLPSGGYYVGGECGQGFYHTLFYKKTNPVVQHALAEAGLGEDNAFVSTQIDRCVWNYQTSFMCKEGFDCSRVRAHHKPGNFKHGSDPNECAKIRDL